MAIPAPNASTQFGDAIQNLDVEGVRDALKSGADPNERYAGYGLSAINIVSTGLALRLPGQQASFAQDEEKAIAILDLLFSAGGKLMVHDKTVLHLPIQAGATNVVRYLLEKGADPTGANEYGMTPGVLAIEYNHNDVLELLIRYGARPLEKSTVAQIKFIRVAREGDVAAMKRELSNGASVNATSPGGKRALVEAASRSSVEAVKFLLAAGANPNLPGQNLFTETALHVAVDRDPKSQSYPEVEIIRLLLDAGARVSSAQGRMGQTPLHIAAHQNNEHTTKLLLDAGAKVMVRDSFGKTPFDWAESGTIIKMLKSYGARE